MLDEITLIPAYLRFPGGHSDDSATTTALRAKFAFRRPFNVAAVGNCDNTSLVSDQILEGDISLFGENRGQTWGSVFVPDPQQLLFDDRHYPIGAIQNVEQIGNLADDFAVFIDDLVAFEPGQLVKAKIENLIRLMFTKYISTTDQTSFTSDADANLLNRFTTEFVGEKAYFGFFAIRGAANNVDKIIQVRERNEIAFECFRSGFCLAEKKTGAPENHIAAMLDITEQRLFQGQQFGPAVVDREHIYREGAFHRGIHVEVVQNDLGACVSLELQFDSCFVV